MQDVLSAYFTSVESLGQETLLLDRTDRIGGDAFRFTKVELWDAQFNVKSETVVSGQPVEIRSYYRCSGVRHFPNTSVSIGFFSVAGRFLFACRSEAVVRQFIVSQEEAFSSRRIHKCPLNSGRYIRNVRADRNGVEMERLPDAGFVAVDVGDFYGTGKVPTATREGVLIEFGWEHKAGNASDLSFQEHA